MKDLIPIDLKDIVESVKAEGKGRRVLWQDSESLAFLSSGRRERKDFHIDPSDEVTLQLSGVPHSPRVEENSWFIVFEHKRKAGEKDLFMWLCEECDNQLYEVSVEVGDYRQDPVSQVHQKFYSDESLRTCKNCGTVIPAPPR